MTTQTAATPSVALLPTDGDISVQITFRPTDPIGMTAVVIEPDPATVSRVVQLVNAAIDRLVTYRDDFTDAEADDDAAPTVLPTPWYAWGR